jgi:hypothetical protein
MLDDLHVAFWPVSFTELPDIDDVSIEDDYRRLYTFQIGEQLFGMATISAKMNVGDNQYVYFTSFLLYRQIIEL